VKNSCGVMRKRLHEGTQEWAENEDGDGAVNEEGWTTTSFLRNNQRSREGGDAMRRTKQKEAKPMQLRRQREVIREVMLSAGQCATWLTFDELAKLTHYPPASISAQLRHMRKPRFGAYEVVKCCRTVNRAMRAEGFGTVGIFGAAATAREGAERVESLPQSTPGAASGELLNGWARALAVQC
jgi:hypothetical protein